MLVYSDIKKSYVFKKMFLAVYHSTLNMQNLFSCDLHWWDYNFPSAPGLPTFLHPHPIPSS